MPSCTFDIARERSYPTPFANSSLLPLLCMSLCKQDYTPRTTDDIEKNYDYIIVGAGTAGCTLAGRLSEKKCVKILLLEAGPKPPISTEVPVAARSFLMTDIDWNYYTEPQKHTGAVLVNRQIPFPIGKAIGGSGIHNAMLYVRGNRKDYDRWAELGAKGWSYEECRPHFFALENDTDPDIANNGYHHVGGPVTVGRPPVQSIEMDTIKKSAISMGIPFVDPNGANQIGLSDFQANIRNGQRCSTAKAYLVPADNRKNLHIVQKARVTKIIMEGCRAVGVEFDHKGRKCQARAREEVILSAGAINTPQLLMLSGIGPRKTLERCNIPVVADLPVGRNLQDHPATFVGFVDNGPVRPIGEDVTDPDNIMLYIKKRKGWLASTEGMISMAFLHNSPSEDPSSVPDYQLYFYRIDPSIPKYQFNYKPGVYEQVFGPYEKKPIMVCGSSVLHPKSRGYVSIRSSNPYDPPIIDPNYFACDKDVKTTINGLKACFAILQTPAAKQLGIVPFQTVIPGCENATSVDDSLECVARSAAITLSHHCGTAKMGDCRDPTTVVDPELRVKCVKGLRVVDTSVMPTVISGNTNVPTIMIAERAATFIKEHIKC